MRTLVRGLPMPSGDYLRAGLAAGLAALALWSGIGAAGRYQQMLVLEARRVDDAERLLELERNIERLGARLDLAEGVPDEGEAALGRLMGSLAAAGPGVRITPVSLLAGPAAPGGQLRVRFELQGEFNRAAQLLHGWERGPTALVVTSLQVHIEDRQGSSRWTVAGFLEQP